MYNEFEKKGVTLQWGSYDPLAQEDARFTILPDETVKKPYADLSLLGNLDVQAPNYATAERNLLVGNGTFRIMPNDRKRSNIALWTSMQTDGNGDFPGNIPSLEINFATTWQHIDGFTLNFDQYNGVYPSIIEAYITDNQGRVQSKIFYPTDSTFIYAEEHDYVQQILLVFRKLNQPYRYLKMDSIAFGLEYTVLRSVSDAKLMREVSMLSKDLVYDVLEISFLDELISFWNHNRLVDMLQVARPMNLTATFPDRTYPIKTMYLESWTLDDDVLSSLRAVDLIGIAEKYDFNGAGFDNTPIATALDQATELMKPMEVVFAIDDNLKYLTVTGNIEPTNCREAIQKILFSQGLYAYVDNTNVIRVRRRVEKLESEIPLHRRGQTQEIVQKDLVTGVKSKISTRRRGETIVVGELDGKANRSYTMKLSNQSDEATINTSFTPAGSGYVIKTTPNTVDVAFTQDGTITITSSTFETFESEEIYKPKDDRISDFIPENVIDISSAELMTPNAARSLSVDIYNFYNQNRYEDTFDILLDIEGIEIGQMVRVHQVHDRRYLDGYITKMDIDLMKDFLTRMLITGDRVFTPIPPPAITTFTATPFKTPLSVGLQLDKNEYTSSVMIRRKSTPWTATESIYDGQLVVETTETYTGEQYYYDTDVDHNTDYYYIAFAKQDDLYYRDLKWTARAYISSDNVIVYTEFAERDPAWIINDPQNIFQFGANGLYNPENSIRSGLINLADYLQWPGDRWFGQTLDIPLGRPLMHDWQLTFKAKVNTTVANNRMGGIIIKFQEDEKPISMVYNYVDSQAANKTQRCALMSDFPDESDPTTSHFWPGIMTTYNNTVIDFTIICENGRIRTMMDGQVVGSEIAEPLDAAGVNKIGIAFCGYLQSGFYPSGEYNLYKLELRDTTGGAE